MGFSDFLYVLITDFEEFLKGEFEGREGEINYYKEQYKEIIDKAEIVIKVMNCLYLEVLTIDWTSLSIEHPEKELKEIMEIYEEIAKKADKIDKIHEEVVKIVKKRFDEKVKEMNKLN